jgi:hypothetical protein
MPRSLWHPCADHPCDDCAICRAGVCCASLSAEQCARLEVALQQSDDTLRAAVRLDAGTVPSLGELMPLHVGGPRLAPRLGAGESSSFVLALPPAPAATLPIDSREEATHVVVPRPIR